MPRPQPTIFVLWGTQFDEAVAVLFITQLRTAGLRVKVVGLDGTCVKGIHGLGLLADLTLDQAMALAAQARCVVIPCTTQRAQQIKHDPRVQDFLAQARANGAELIIW